MASITMDQFNNIVELTIDTQIVSGIVPLIIGNHGIGKTTVISNMAEEHGCDLVILNLATQSVEDLLGFPDGEGGFKKPEWLVKTSSKRTIYFLDEINRAPTYVLQAMFNFISEGRVHNHRIEEGDVIIAAGNPPGKDYNINEFEDKAFLDRFAIFYLEPDKNSFIDYLTQCEMPLPGFTEAISMCTLQSNHVDEKYVRIPSNRGITKISRLAKEMYSKDPDTFYLMAMGMVGIDMATIIQKMLKDGRDMLTVDDIIEGRLDNLDPEDISIITTLNMKLASYLKSVEVPSDKLKDAVAEYCKVIPRDSEAALLSAIRKATSGGYAVKLLGVDYISDLLEVSKNN